MRRLISKFWYWLLGLTTIDEAAVAAVKETKRRAKRVKSELKDVAEAVKEVGKQVSDVKGAIKGDVRKGRKRKNAK